MIFLKDRNDSTHHFLIGSFRVQNKLPTLTGFRTKATQALLIYLTTEAFHPEVAEIYNTYKRLGAFKEADTDDAGLFLSMLRFESPVHKSPVEVL